MCGKQNDCPAPVTYLMELENRELALAVGRCDYCGRLGNTNACRFPERHALAQKALRERDEAHKQSILNTPREM
jgi:hypothetical protein